MNHDVLNWYPTRRDEGRIRVLNRASQAPLEWSVKELVHQVVPHLQKRFGERLVSLGLRGSVAYYNQLVPKSDVDLYALVRDGDPQPFGTLQLSEFPRVDLGWTRVDESFRSGPHRFATILAVQGRTVWGEPIVEGLDAPSLDDLKLNRTWWETDVEAFRREEEIASKETPNIQQRMLGQRMIKTVLRGAFESVMEELDRYASDLYTCACGLGEYDEQMGRTAMQIYRRYRHPAAHRASLLTAVDTLKNQLEIAGK